MGWLTNHYPGDGLVLAVDLDGTLTERDSRGEDLGPPRTDVVAVVAAARRRGWRVVVHSARPVAHEPAVAEWLATEAVPYDHIALGAKPPADVFLDDRGLLPPLHVVDAHLAWLEGGPPLSDEGLDRLARGGMAGRWAREQYAVPENPHPPVVNAGEYRVVVPLTGGMDSSTLWAMAAEAGLPAHAVYVDCGQDYADAEVATVRALFGVALPVLPAPVAAVRWAHIMPGRNAAIVVAVARWMAQQGWWGELWLGNLAGETPAVGGDKSARFLATMQHLLTVWGVDVQLMHPLRGMDKPDLVRWWAARGALPTLAATKSCFDTQARACGACQTCFRKAAAFLAAGQDLPPFDRPPEFAAHVSKYEKAMTAAVEAQDWRRYSPARCRDTLAGIAAMRDLGLA